MSRILQQQYVKLLKAQGPLPGKDIPLLLKKLDTYIIKGMPVQDAVTHVYQHYIKSKPTYTRKTTPSPIHYAVSLEDIPQKSLQKVQTTLHTFALHPRISQLAVMPDVCPVGEHDMPVGCIAAVDNALIPSLHSADICCSLHATFFDAPHDVATIMDHLTKETRFGPGGRKPNNYVYHPILEEFDNHNMFLSGLHPLAVRHLADQGDGNHFAVLGKVTLTQQLLTYFDQNTQQLLRPFLNKQLYCLVTHHGSRGLGARVYKRAKNKAIELSKQYIPDIMPHEAWIDYNTDEGKAYWEALEYIKHWTKANHVCIHTNLLKALNVNALAAFGNEHNFVWKKENTFYHAKGATPVFNPHALALIPLNMGDGILIVQGDSHNAFMHFAPHGAGRDVSRSQLAKNAIETFGSCKEAIQHEFSTRLKHVDVRWYHGKPDISEFPIAYKDPQKIYTAIQQYQLAHIVAKITPLGSLMAGHISHYH